MGSSFLFISLFALLVMGTEYGSEYTSTAFSDKYGLQAWKLEYWGGTATSEVLDETDENVIHTELEEWGGFSMQNPTNTDLVDLFQVCHLAFNYCFGFILVLRFGSRNVYV
jgi:hypothetical protein